MLNKFFSLFSHDIGIDLGTSNTLVYVAGRGIAIREPSVVALHKKTKKIIAIGGEAKKMVGKTPSTITIVKPLRSGVISDFDVTAAMISHYIKKVHETGALLPSFARPKVVIGIPSSVTEVERRAVWEAALVAGAREAFLIEEPMAAAIGEGVSVFAPTGVMVVDIGGGTTEIAIISLGGIVVGKSFRMAGNEMDQAILHYVRLRHGLLLGEPTAEEVKIKIGSVYKKSSTHSASSGRELPPSSAFGGLRRGEQNSRLRQGFGGQAKLDSKPVAEEVSQEVTEEQEEKEKVVTEVEKGEKMAIVRGRDIETGLPKSIRINETEAREALAPVISRIIEEIADVLEEAPPELVGDILEHGIMLTGGGAMLTGLDHLIVERTHIPVIIASDPLTAVVRGTGKVLEDSAFLARVKVTGGLR